jgi:hypothetical protein
MTKLWPYIIKPNTMKQIRTLLLFAIFALFFSCGGNRMKNNEKALAKQILTEEEQLAQEAARRNEREKQLADSIAKLPQGFRFKEDRSIDPQRPPLVIDIAGNRTNPQKVKLSQLFSKIEYIRLEHNPDSIGRVTGTGFIVSNNHIYSHSNIGGLIQFDLNGHFKQYICKNRMWYISFSGKQSDVPRGQSRGAKSAYLAGNQLIYTFLDEPNKKYSFVAFDDNSQEIKINLKRDIELKIFEETKGTIFSTISGDGSPFQLYPHSNGMVSSISTGKNPFKPTNFSNLISKTGDTICRFEDFDPIKNYAKTLWRGSEGGNAYYLDGVLHIRQTCNDTIYVLMPPNRLIPKYILNFGDLGIKSAQELIDPGFSLKEKLLLKSIIETDRYVLIEYSKGYYAPVNRQLVKFSRIIFDKKNKTVVPIYIDESPAFVDLKEWTKKYPAAPGWPAPTPPNVNIENDIDGMPFNWPTSVTANGKPFSIISGEDLLKLKNQNLPVKNIRKNDLIIAIYH